MVNITNLRRIDKGALVASFTVELPSGLAVNECVLFEKEGRRWISGPSREFAKADGTKGRQPLVAFASREANDKFQALVLPAVEKVLGGGAWE